MKKLSTNGDEYWKPSETPDKILGQWIYLGRGLAAVHGNTIEPSLIDPSLPIDETVADCSVRHLDYWPSYSSASPQARAAYIHWLRTGRDDPAADLGYVFLYFYGLERRALHDANHSILARNELTEIQAEINRLITIYVKSLSFQQYAGSLLDLLQFKVANPRQYDRKPPPLRGQRFLTFEHRLALAQCAADQVPLPAEWAFTWFKGTHSPGKITGGCPVEFNRLFELRYGHVFGQGMSIPKNKTLLKLEHRPASPTFAASFSRTIEPPLPDVTVISYSSFSGRRNPNIDFDEVAQYCFDRLSTYSRFIRSNPQSATTFDAIVELPVELWPDKTRAHLAEARKHLEQSSNPQLHMTFKELRAWFPEWHIITRRKLKSFCQALGSAGLGIEPDIRFGGEIPDDDSVMIVFADISELPEAAPTPQYSAAALTMQLAAAVSTADSMASGIEKNLLKQHLETWLHLAESEKRRLHAHLRHMLTEPPQLSGINKRVDALDASQKTTIGDFLTRVALADAVATSSEIAVLEKTFKLLGLDPKSVYSKVHIAATEPVTVRAPDSASSGYAIPSPQRQQSSADFRLDSSKVAALEADSARVVSLLRNIFNQPEPEPEPEPEPLTEIVDSHEISFVEAGLPGLNSELASLMRTILTRASWTREELEEIASDRGIMLDGALEQINDAAYIHFDAPLFEGQDPIDINQEIIGRVPQ